MNSGGDFKLVQGCIPCAFYCNCCEGTHYRCMTGTPMYLWENKYTNETYSILCGDCYFGCTQSPYKGCNQRQKEDE